MAILTFEQRHDLGKDPLLCPSKIYSAENMAILTIEQRLIRGKPFCFVLFVYYEIVHISIIDCKFTLLCMSILTLEQIFI